MPLRICPTCRGGKVVRHGAQYYRCSQCGGAGGIPLGEVTVAQQADPTIPDGKSRAAERIARGLQLPGRK